VVVWQLAYLTDRVLPIPNLLIDALPIIGLLALPLVRGGALRKTLSRVCGHDSETTIEPGAGLRGAVAGPRATRLRAAIAVAIVLFAAAVSVTQGPIYRCDDRPSDCHSYVKMVDSIAFDASRLDGDSGPWPEYGSHHFMRVLPPLMVRGLTELGFGVDSGFRIVSAGAYVVFALLLLSLLLRASRDALIACAFTLLILGVHRAMSFPLRDVYQATDALAYPISLGIIALTMANRWRWVFLLALVGIATKQNLFVLSTLALAYLWIRNRNQWERFEIATLAIVSVSFYVGLSQYYRASGTVAKHLLPSAGPGLLDKTIGFAVREGLLALFLPLLPLVLWYGRGAARLLLRYWFIGVYVVIAVAQPILSFTTGGNLQRVALHGVWPIYLAMALTASTASAPRILKWLLLPYAVSIFAHPHLADRLVVVGVMLCASTALWAMSSTTSVRQQPATVQMKKGPIAGAS
jgi:hypothetical protein